VFEDSSRKIWYGEAKDKDILKKGKKCETKIVLKLFS
jgi:hypothetical protein